MEYALAAIAMLCILAAITGALWIAAHAYVRWRHLAWQSKADYAQAMADVDATRIRAESEGRAVILRAMVAPATEGGTATIFDERGALVIGEVRQLVPHTLTDARRYTTPMLPTPAASVDMPVELPPVAVPTFADLLQRGVVGTGDFTLGYTVDGQPVTGGWDSLYSSAIGGVQDTGKTTTTRFVLAQAALHNARFALVDPMRLTQNAARKSLAHTLMPLEGRFLCAPATTPEEIQELLALIRMEFDRRRKGGSFDFPIILVVDEFGMLMRSAVAPQLPPLLLDIAQLGAHTEIFAACLSQNWLSATSGGSAVRGSFASRYVHRMPRDQARLLLPPEEARLCERLPKGQSILARTDGSMTTVVIPNTTAADIETVARLLDVATVSPKSDHSVSISPMDTTPLQSAKLLDPQEARIISLFCAGKSVADIVRTLHGDVVGGAMQKKNTEVQEVIRKFVAQMYGNGGLNLE